MAVFPPLLFGFLVFLETVAPSSRAGPGFMGFMTAFSIIFSCIWVPIWGIIGLWLILRLFLKPNYPVKKAEGPVYILNNTYLDSSDNASTTYLLGVGHMHFFQNIGSDLADYLKQGDVYAIYYVITRPQRRYRTHSDPAVRKIVSLEKLADAAQPQPSPFFQARPPSS